MKNKLVEKLFRGTCTRDELKKLLDLIARDPTPPDSALIEKLWQEAEEYPDLEEVLFDRVFSKSMQKMAGEKSAFPFPAGR